MFPEQMRDTVVDSIIGVVHLTFGFLVVGRALNSSYAYRLSPHPVVGPVTDSLRAAFNQIYDVSGQD